MMLANIASIEIPPLPASYVDWLRALSATRLDGYGIDRAAIEDRAFYPRLVLGDYLSDQFAELVAQGRNRGIEITVYTQAAVVDVRLQRDSVELDVQSRVGETTHQNFDYVVLATGHQWPPEPEIHSGYFINPYPASALARIRNCAVGIRGTSLSAIDAAVVLADAHGEFNAEADGAVRYTSSPGTDGFTITLFSRKGVLPGADFYHPIPYEPLAFCTPQAMQALIQGPTHGLLDAAFKLFCRELTEVDPVYARQMSVSSASLEQFCEAYFAERENADPFAWAAQDLARAVDNFEKTRTVPWQYAILRMHEVFGLLAQHLDDDDFERFSQCLKPVFVDAYTTVPHESIRRLLALNHSGKLQIEKLDAQVRIDTRSATRGALILRGGTRRHFPAFVEATGQKILGADDFPFPSLRRAGVIRDVPTEATSETQRGIAVDGHYHPLSSIEPSERLFCLSLPFLLGQHPFAQGITSSAEMADVVAEAIAQTEHQRKGTRSAIHAT